MFVLQTLKQTIMTIQNLIVYRNPVGDYVEDYVTDFQLSKLFKNGVVLPFDYKLRCNFWHGLNPDYLRLVFIYFVRHSHFNF